MTDETINFVEQLTFRKIAAACRLADAEYELAKLSHDLGRVDDAAFEVERSRYRDSVMAIKNEWEQWQQRNGADG
jgi:hypothetical protein